MSMKTWAMIGMSVGSTLGAVAPMIFGDASLLDGWLILGILIGGILGIWLEYKIGKALN